METLGYICYRCQTIQISGWTNAPGRFRARYLLVNGLEEFPLVLPDFGVVHLPHKFGVFVDEPRLPENIRSRVFHLEGVQHRQRLMPRRKHAAEAENGNQTSKRMLSNMLV